MAELVPAGLSVVDVGTGDGQLAAALAARGDCPRVIGVELGGSHRRAASRLAGTGVELREGSGLRPIGPGEVEVAVVAGMGGNLIARILADSPDVLASLKLLVLQPMQRLEPLRAQLLGLGCREVGEATAVQAGRRYTVLTVVPHESR